MKETTFTAGNILSSSAVNLQLYERIFSEFVFLAICTVVMQVIVSCHFQPSDRIPSVRLSLIRHCVDTVWAVRPNQYHFTSNTTA